MAREESAKTSLEGLEAKTDPCTLIIFGASGDLTRRKLIPALHSLDCDGLLPDSLRILGVARTKYSDQGFRHRLREGVEKYGRLNPEVWGDFDRRLAYMPGSYDDPQTFQRLRERLDGEGLAHQNRLFYLAIPPMLYGDVIDRLGEAGLNRSQSGWRRVIVEKPFGRDLESGRQLNRDLHTYFDEDQIYRIDHYLGKETVQNILTFRFANFIFQEMWNRNFIDHVQITAVERVGVGRRAGYYDQAGVVRDMMQNHLLQLLSLTAMEPPTSMNPASLRDEKIKVLRAIHPLELTDGVGGQYRGYRDEQDIDPHSTTRTYIAQRVYIENWRWQGVPFYLRSGKSLAEKNTEITLKFKRVPHLIFPKNHEMESNRLSLCLQPDEGMHLRFQLKVPGAEMRTSPVNMDFHYQELLDGGSLPESYERLLLDAIQGDPSLFARSDEIERAWELVTPLLEDWENAAEPPMHYYDPGSWGPQEADELVRNDGREWMNCCRHSARDSG
jgi:glucose-6-phosphate 1-dehydrogenase